MTQQAAGQSVPQPSRQTILLGVTGSIAAYKAAELASQLTQAGVEVLTIMTRAACQFVSPVTFQALTGQPVGTDLFAEGQGSKVEHIAIARRADLVLIAPASADHCAKLAYGLADDLLSTAVLATTAPVLIAPAMNPAMWSNPVVQENLARLRTRGFEIIEPGHGLLACGEVGPGRMAEPAEILEYVHKWRSAVGAWKGVAVLVTAGPTREYLDAVRYISNPSSGKMGYALAREARRRGANVRLIAGPVSLPDPFGVQVIRVTTGEDMRHAVLEHAAWARVVIKSAAVTDYRPDASKAGKMKDEQWTLKLHKVSNILEELGSARAVEAQAGRRKILVGFAAESGDPEPEGERKLQARGLDLVVANDVSLEGSGFGSDMNQATLMHADGRRERLPRLPKLLLAQSILSAIEPLLTEASFPTLQSRNL